MNLQIVEDNNFFEIIKKINFCYRYIELCNKFDLNRPISKKPLRKELLLRTEIFGGLKKIPGASNVYDFKTIPEGMQLRIVIKSAGAVDTMLSIGEYHTSFPVLYNKTMKFFDPDGTYYFPVPLGIDLDEYINMLSEIKLIFSDLIGEFLNLK